MVAADLLRASPALGPLFVLFHHWWLTGDALAFYRGPYSPRAIQGKPDYPGYHDWSLAFLYYRTAAQLCAGPCLPLIALAGVLAALWRAGLLAAGAARAARRLLRLEHVLYRRHADFHSRC